MYSKKPLSDHAAIPRGHWPLWGGFIEVRIGGAVRFPGFGPFSFSSGAWNYKVSFPNRVRILGASDEIGVREKMNEKLCKFFLQTKTYEKVLDHQHAT